MINQKKIDWIVIAFFAGLIAVVFQQINTSMKEQGIASGGPYDNAAAFPKSVAIFIVLLVVLQVAADLYTSRVSPKDNASVLLISLWRPSLMLLIFVVYLSLLTPLGYHITTTPMMFGIMWISGAHQDVKLILMSLAISFGLAFVFEIFLNVVLPGGVLSLNIPW